MTEVIFKFSFVLKESICLCPKTVGNVNQSKAGGHVWDVPFKDGNHLQGQGFNYKSPMTRNLGHLMIFSFRNLACKTVRGEINF